jgi:hypothetical protein
LSIFFPLETENESAKPISENKSDEIKQDGAQYGTTQEMPDASLADKDLETDEAKVEEGKQDGGQFGATQEMPDSILAEKDLKLKEVKAEETKTDEIKVDEAKLEEIKEAVEASPPNDSTDSKPENDQPEISSQKKE